MSQQIKGRETCWRNFEADVRAASMLSRQSVMVAAWMGIEVQSLKRRLIRNAWRDEAEELFELIKWERPWQDFAFKRTRSRVVSSARPAPDMPAGTIWGGLDDDGSGDVAQQYAPTRWLDPPDHEDLQRREA